VTDRLMDRRTTRTITIAGPHIVAGQLISRWLFHGQFYCMDLQFAICVKEIYTHLIS